MIDENVYNDKDKLKTITKARNIKLKEDRSLNLITDEEIPGYIYASNYYINKYNNYKYNYYFIRCLIMVSFT
jgi:hypothetical protein